MAIAAVATSPVHERPIRVMVVDDALVVRGIVARWLQEEGGVEIVATHRSAKNALDDLDRARPDVLILDIEMPDMDGVTALPLFLARRPDLAVIVASTLTRRNAELSIRCLSLGAMDCLAKPQTSGEMTTTADFRRELTDRVRALGSRAISRTLGIAGRAAPIARAPVHGAPQVVAEPMVRSGPPDNSFMRRSGEPLKLRKFPSMLPRALVIGSSTGGPQALAVLFGGIKKILPRVPVLVTQHMPPSFTTILAEHLGRVAGVPCHEPTDGEAIRAGTIYVAPGGYHMTVVQGENGPVARINDDPPVNFCKPAVDPLFYSSREIWGGGLAAIVLTGMGSDGARGALAIADAGGAVIAQDEELSVVWGMPGATAHAGACSAILPLSEIAPKVVNSFWGGAFMTPTELEFLGKFLKERSGLVLVGDKSYLIESRLMPIARKHNMASLSVLMQKLRAGQPALESEVVEAMTTNETFFFRDKVPFDLFTEVMLPHMAKARAQQRRLRIWCAACSSGQEPYSLAMILREEAAKFPDWGFEILATDLSGEVLAKAKSGRFSQFEVQRGLPIQMLIKNFEQVGDLWEIAPEIRSKVQFRPINLLRDFTPLGTFDIVFCRNVLIYFDEPSKVDVLNRMAGTVASDGFLVLGAAETVVGLCDKFKSVPEKRGMYVRNMAADLARPPMRLVANARR